MLSNLAFDYRIVAHPADADDERLPVVREKQNAGLT